jgi:hypothetical protein
MANAKTTFSQFLIEAPIFSPDGFNEYSDEQIQKAISWLATGKELTKLENGKWSIIKNDDFYGIKKGEEIRGWVCLKPENEYLHLVILYILPEFRNSNALSILMFGIKSFLEKPILISQKDPISKDGWKLFKSVLSKNIMGAKTLHNNILSDYKDGDELSRENAIILEAGSKATIIVWPLPGQTTSDRYWEFFKDDIDNG